MPFTITLIAAVVNLLEALLYYLYLFPKIYEIYTDAGLSKEDPLGAYEPIIIFLFFFLVSCWFWFFLKRKSKQGISVGYGLIASVLLIFVPYVIVLYLFVPHLIPVSSDPEF